MFTREQTRRLRAAAAGVRFTPEEFIVAACAKLVQEFEETGEIRFRAVAHRLSDN